MTSRLVVNSVRHTGASADAITLDASGNVTFPANATCSGTATGFGTVRQHKILSKTTKSSTTSLTPGIIPDFSITITPTASDSIMVIEASMYFSITQHVISTRIYKDSDIVIQPATYDSNDDGSSSHYVGSNTDRMMQQTISSFETAGNTNARTYSVYWRVSSGTAYMNRYTGSDSYNGVSTLRVTEMAP
tara:strand:+ start:254 stop:823 length:570 start_codon:yes stop_codon:yes gene_type:complete